MIHYYPTRPDPRCERCPPIPISCMYQNLLSSSSMVTVVVDGFNMTVLSTDVRDIVKDLVLSTTVSPVMGIITVWFVLPALNVRSMDTVM